MNVFSLAVCVMTKTLVVYVLTLTDIYECSHSEFEAPLNEVFPRHPYNDANKARKLSVDVGQA